MPIYSYRCRDCSTTFDVLMREGADVVCPECGSRAWDKLLSTPFVLSGQATRQPGRTCCGREERCTEPPCAGGEPCARG